LLALRALASRKSLPTQIANMAMTMADDLGDMQTLQARRESCVEETHRRMD